MSSVKHIEALGVLAKIETTYLTSAAPTTTADGVQIIKPRPDVTTSFLYDGSRTVQAGGYGRIQRQGQYGRAIAGSIRCEAKGNGSAYASAAVTVPHIHPLLRAAGFDAALGSSTAWTFTPTAATTAPASVTLALYGAGELWTGVGAYTNLKISCQDGGIPVFEFPFVAAMPTDPSDVALPAITYHSQTVIPPVAAGVAFTLGGVGSLILRTFDFDFGRSIDTARRNINAAAQHGGFAPGQRDPLLKVLIEAPAISTYDFYNAVENASTSSFTLTIGSTQYNRYTLSSAQCQIIDVRPADDGPVAMYEVDVKPFATSQVATDDVSLVFN